MKPHAIQKLRADFEVIAQAVQSVIEDKATVPVEVWKQMRHFLTRTLASFAAQRGDAATQQQMEKVLSVIYDQETKARRSQPTSRTHPIKAEHSLKTDDTLLLSLFEQIRTGKRKPMSEKDMARLRQIRANYATRRNRTAPIQPDHALKTTDPRLLAAFEQLRGKKPKNI